MGIINTRKRKKPRVKLSYKGTALVDQMELFGQENMPVRQVTGNAPDFISMLQMLADKFPENRQLQDLLKMKGTMHLSPSQIQFIQKEFSVHFTE